MFVGFEKSKDQDLLIAGFPGLRLQRRSWRPFALAKIVDFNLSVTKFKIQLDRACFWREQSSMKQEECSKLFFGISKTCCKAFA